MLMLSADQARDIRQLAYFCMFFSGIFSFNGMVAIKFRKGIVQTSS
jgi:hypothetical protein